MVLFPLDYYGAMQNNGEDTMKWAVTVVFLLSGLLVKLGGLSVF